MNTKEVKTSFQLERDQKVIDVTAVGQFFYQLGETEFLTEGWFCSELKVYDVRNKEIHLLAEDIQPTVNKLFEELSKEVGDN